MTFFKTACLLPCLAAALLSALGAAAAAPLSLNNAVLVSRPGELPAAEESAAVVLVEEVAKRTGVTLERRSTWPDDRPVIALTSEARVEGWSHDIPAGVPDKTDAFGLFTDTTASGMPVVWVVGADPRGVLYGAGVLLRKLEWGSGRLGLAGPLNFTTSPVSPIRGHQLGYRAAANSWDAWDAAQFDQYIRELAFFGANAIENIPFQDDRRAPLMKMDRRDMNIAMSKICARYGLEYWVWTPATFDLNDTEKRDELLKRHEDLYRDCPELTGIFFPGGDPGDNPPELVLPFLEDLSKLLLKAHPKAKIWLSLQGFTEAQTDYVLDFLNANRLPWLGGLCEGPSSPPIALLRNRLPKHYGLRMYPDITHNKLCQYPVPWWDQAYALTLGREAINPRPAQYAYIHNWFQPYCDGFISYSDGVHDDVNKTVWSALAWDPATPLRDILMDYTRVFFGPGVTYMAADGISALENNWRGSLADNGAVMGTLRLWRELESLAPELAGNWRWQMCLVRAYYDALVRARLLNETALESEANAALLRADTLGAGPAMEEALAILGRADTEPPLESLRERVIELYNDLFHSIGLQSSVEKYGASGAERGASLDFIDIPLNNRWWLEDEFKKVAEMAVEADKVARLREIALWEHPGPGSFYDDIGNTAKSPRIQRSEVFFSNPAEEAQPEPLFWWWDDGKSRQRLSWQLTMDWPEAAVYEGLDPDAAYRVRTCGYGQEILSADGVRLRPEIDGRGLGEIKEYAVPAELLKDRKLTVTWDHPEDEKETPWRQRSRVAEVWLIRR